MFSSFEICKNIQYVLFKKMLPTTYRSKKYVKIHGMVYIFLLIYTILGISHLYDCEVFFYGNIK